MSTMLKMNLLLIVLLFSFSCCYGSSTVITFDEPYTNCQDGYGPGDKYFEGDYFVSTESDPGHHGSIIRINPFNQNALVPNNGTIHMAVLLFANPFLQRIDGKAFTLVSLDIGEFNEGIVWVREVPIVGYKEDGSALHATLGLDRVLDGFGGVNDFQHYELNWEDIVRLEFHQTGFSFDNIEVVPEPATVCLLGLGGFGLLRKRRNA